MYFLKNFFAILLVVTNNTECLWNNDSTKLEFVFAVFRQGDRTMPVDFTYPKDPFINETYYPYGKGKLTNEGRQTAYLLGRKIRERYHDFLNDIYRPGSIDAVTTNMSRTNESLEFVLAGLYSPMAAVPRRGKSLNSQPMSYQCLTDDSSRFPMTNCRKFIKSYEAFRMSPEGQVIEKRYSQHFNFISENTGLTVNNVYDLFHIHFSLSAQSEWGFTIPSWTDHLYPKYFENAVKDIYASTANDTQRKQLCGGLLLKKIMNEMHLQIANGRQKDSRKIFLYSGHEFNIAYVLSAMEVYYPHIPKYGACVFVELHKLHQHHGIRVFYLDGPRAEPKSLVIPGCEELCEFGKFENLLRKNVPDGIDCLTE